MWFVVLGVLLGAMKLLDVGPPSVWSWGWVLSPFVLAVVWWWWADTSGYTKRKEMDAMDAKKVERRNRSLVALGIDPRAHEKRRANAFKASQQRKVSEIEGKRDAKRQKQRDSILSSRFDSSQMSGLDTQQPGDTKR